MNVNALRECLDYIVRRHEIFRTTFAQEDGRPVQIVHRYTPITVPFVDLAHTVDPEAEATGLLRAEARRPFDLTCLPLIRFSVVRIREDVHWLLRVNHHIISDSMSWAIFFRELGPLYEAALRGVEPPLSEFEPLQYCDYAAWQRRALAEEGPAFRMALDSWKSLLACEPEPLELPFKRTIPVPDAEATLGLFWWGLSNETSKRLEQLQRAAGASYFVVRLAAFSALLADECGRDDLVVGTYVTNRNRFELQDMIGFFANLATLWVRFDRTLSFRAWVARAARSVGEAQARGRVPYELLCASLRREGTIPPEIRAIFNVSEQPGNMHFGGLELSWLDRRMETMPWGFSLTLDRYSEDRRCRADFDARIYDPERVRAFIARFLRFLEAASIDPDSGLVELLRMTKTGDSPPIVRDPPVDRIGGTRLPTISGGSNVELQKKRILVTGGSGFLGRHVLAELKERGFKNVSAFSRPV